MNQSELLALLETYHPDDTTEAAMLLKIKDFVAAHDAPWSRKLAVGHITASAWILNPDATQVLLCLHRKLGIWVQPGGHVDEADASAPDAALREAVEETGLADLALPERRIFDVDIHSIPARAHEPAHEHLDLRFRFVASHHHPLTISEESHDLAWVPLEDVAQRTTEESILRMVRKSQ